MQVRWNDIERGEWDALHRTAVGPLQQSWAYGQAMAAAGVVCLRARLLHQGRNVGLAQFLGRRLGGLIGLALCPRGPLMLPPHDDAAGLAAACRALGRGLPLARPRVTLFSPSSAHPLPGLHRVVTGQSVVLLDLQASPEALRAGLHGKWRNRLAAAERAGLRAQRVGAKPAQYGWLLERELAQREGRGYQALPPGFVPAWQAAAPPGAEPMLAWRVDVDREAVAGMMFLVHGDSATYHVGWADARGREAGAHNLLLWQAMLALRERGVRRLDLGGIDTAGGAGLARFKIGTGGQVAGFSGTWVAPGDGLRRAVS